MTKSAETCARCGHASLGCERCDRVDPFLGSMIGGKLYCHTFSPSAPTCYEKESWERPFAPYTADDPWIVRPLAKVIRGQFGPRPTEETP